MAESLDERARDVLRAVVREFISTGDPVGSAQLTRTGEFEVSSATMRNVLAELEELGYLDKPHTSAGRIPTDQGYRFFVDSLVEVSEPKAHDKDRIQMSASVDAGLDERLHEASKVLQQLSRHASVVLTPRPSALTVTRIEFVRLRDDRLLAIVVSSSGQVQNKLLTVDFAMSRDELNQASNYLNTLMQGGRSLEEVRSRILAELEGERAQYDQLAGKALKLGAAATHVEQADRLIIEGAGTFLDAPEFADDLKRMRALFHALDEKHKLLSLLDRVGRAGEMQIYIGAESEFSARSDVSVIASPYRAGGQVLGTVGVIGPTRMDYQRVIPLVGFTAQVLTRLLDDES